MDFSKFSYSDDDDAAAALLLLHLLAKRKLQKRKRRNRLMWTKAWIAGRLEYGAYHCLLKELRQDDPAACRNFLRMDWASFEYLLSAVGPLIRKRDTHLRQCIKPEERLAVTLRWLATGKT